MNEFAAAFANDQVELLTGISRGRLASWEKYGVVTPRFKDDSGWLRYNRLYSFRDLVVLRASLALRETYRIPLRGLRDANSYLQQHYMEPWDSLTFWVVGQCVVVDESSPPDCLKGVGVGKGAIPFPLAPFLESMREKVRAFQARAPREVGTIERSPRIMGGLPVLAGTHIPTKAIWSFHEAGYDTAGILQQYPQLHPRDIQVAIDYEASLRKHTA